VSEQYKKANLTHKNLFSLFNRTPFCKKYCASRNQLFTSFFNAILGEELTLFWRIRRKGFHYKGINGEYK
jgi:hypothetical protein